MRRVGEVQANNSYRDSTFYSIERGAASRLILMNDLKLRKASSTRAIAVLTSYGILRLCLPLPRPRGKKGGPRARLYETPDSEPKQVVNYPPLKRWACDSTSNPDTGWQTAIGWLTSALQRIFFSAFSRHSHRVRRIDT